MRRYPTLPGPWRTRENLPVEMQQLPIELLRRDLTTRAPNIMNAVLFGRQMFNPFAILPRKYGPGAGGAVGGVTAVYDADNRLAAMHDYVLQQVGAPAPDAPPTVRLSYVMGAVDTQLPSNMPFTPRAGLPVVALEEQARLRHLPLREGYSYDDQATYDALEAISDNEANRARFRGQERF